MNQCIQLIAILTASLTIGSAPAVADPVRPDTLIGATAQPARGLDLARRQIRSGDFAEALATLERLIIEDPDDAISRLFHAAVLCRSDDAGGSQVEFEMLQGRELSDGIWQEAVAPCDALTARRTGDGR